MSLDKPVGDEDGLVFHLIGDAQLGEEFAGHKLPADEPRHTHGLGGEQHRLEFFRRRDVGLGRAGLDGEAHAHLGDIGHTSGVHLALLDLRFDLLFRDNQQIGGVIGAGDRDLVAGGGLIAGAQRFQRRGVA